MNSFLNRKLSFVLYLVLAVFFLAPSLKASAKPGDNYSAEKAIAFADSCFKKSGSRYVANPNKKYGRELCAGYVSQCLREGGMTEDSTWYWHGIGKTPFAWRVSNSLYNYLKNQGYHVTYSPKASQVNPGDVIFYRTNGGWGHVSICTGKTANGTPYVNAYNNPRYHTTNWTMHYQTCVFSMTTKPQTPEFKETTIKDGKQITLSCQTSNVRIYYTTNGKTPTTSSAMYTAPFTLKENSNVKAIAVSSSKTKSDVSTFYVNTEKEFADGTYMIFSASSETKVLGIPSTSKEDGKTIELTKKSENYNRKFTFQYLGNGTYRISMLHSGKALTELEKETSISSPKTSGLVATSSAITAATSGTKSSFICQQKVTNGKNQQWKIIYKSKNKFYLQNAATGHYLTVAPSLSTGLSAYPEQKTASKGQLWNFAETKTSNVTVSGANYPASLRKGQSFFIYGHLTSSASLTSVTILVQNSSGTTTESASAKPKAKQYNLHELSPKIKFRKLAKGKYKYIVKVQDATGQETILLTKSFVVK